MTISNLEKVGVFYTHNRVDKKILQGVISYLNEIIIQKNIQIVASSYIPLEGFNGVNLISKMKNPCHLSIALQILQCLLHARKLNPDYKFVSFLEHDILYPLDYFDYPTFEENVMCNTQYIQLSNTGFENSKGGKPLSQLVMKFSFAITHFINKIPAIFDGDSKLEPRNEVYLIGKSTPPLHFRHANYTTTHFNTFDKKYHLIDPFWGDAENIKKEYGAAIVNP